MKPRQLRDLTDVELQRRLAETRQELFNLRFQSATGALENSARLRLAKREIEPQVETVDVPAAERPVRDSGPEEGVRGNPEVPPADNDSASVNDAPETATPEPTGEETS